MAQPRVTTRARPRAAPGRHHEGRCSRRLRPGPSQPARAPFGGAPPQRPRIARNAAEPHCREDQRPGEGRPSPGGRRFRGTKAIRRATCPSERRRAAGTPGCRCSILLARRVRPDVAGGPHRRRNGARARGGGDVVGIRHRHGARRDRAGRRGGAHLGGARLRGAGGGRQGRRGFPPGRCHRRHRESHLPRRRTAGPGALGAVEAGRDHGDRAPRRSSVRSITEPKMMLASSCGGLLDERRTPR